MAHKPNNNLKRSIVFLTRLYVPHVGGVETHIEQLSQVLRKRGYRITVVTQQHDIALPLKEQVRGIDIIRIPFSKQSKLQVWAWMVVHHKLFTSAQLVHAHDVFWWFLPLRLLNPKVPVFTTFHGYEGSEPPTKKAIRSRKFSERLSNGNICVGLWMKQWYGTRPTHVVYGASSFKPKQRPLRSNTAAFIGRLADDTGVLEYISAISSLNGKVRLEIYGAGPLASHVEKLVMQFPYIKYHGETTAVESVLAKHRFAFVSRYLGMIEAMRVGRLVFAQWNNTIKFDYLTSFPAISNAVVFHTAEELKNQLLDILRNEKKERQLVTSARDWAMKQTWDSIADRYESLWNM